MIIDFIDDTKIEDMLDKAKNPAPQHVHDTRTIDEVVLDITERGHIPSFLNGLLPLGTHRRQGFYGSGQAGADSEILADQRPFYLLGISDGLCHCGY